MVNLRNIEADTKKAWEVNWQPHEIENILEIFRYPRVKKQLAIYLKYLPKKEKVLEGGCGLGPYLIYLHNAGFDIIGVDYNEEPLKKIKAYDAAIKVSVMDVRRLLFKEETFGGYLSLGVIEHFPEGPYKAINEAYRVLKKGGIFIVQVPIRNIFLNLKYPLELLKRNKLLRKIFGKKEKVYYWQQYFKSKDLQEILNNAGFGVEEVIPMDHEHSIINFSGFFRDKRSYDGANTLGIRLSQFCERYLKWLTAANMIIVCRKG
jgi:SAM-dependent methyltransferase